MNWMTVRLELGRTTDFPEGSASRAYLLRVPLDESGLIDESALSREPGHATVRRFWPSEPDLVGQIVATPAGWALSYERAAPGDGRIGKVGSHPIRIGAEVAVTEPDGRVLPFRVASLRKAA